MLGLIDIARGLCLCLLVITIWKIIGIIASRLFERSIIGIVLECRRNRKVFLDMPDPMRRMHYDTYVKTAAKHDYPIWDNILDHNVYLSNLFESAMTEEEIRMVSKYRYVPFLDLCVVYHIHNYLRYMLVNTKQVASYYGDRDSCILMIAASLRDIAITLFGEERVREIMSVIYDRAYPGYKPAISVIQKSTIDVDTDIVERVDSVEDIEHNMPYVIDPAKFDQDALLQIMGDVYDNVMDIITNSIGLDGDDIRVIKETYRHSEVEV